MRSLNYQQASFLLSATNLAQLPEDEGVEVAFVGRSNSGKSSALNAITQNKKLARISKTPGRTRAINLFEIDKNCRLVDLPGYGYAKVSISQREQWGKMIADYLHSRHCLKGLVMIMDIRHPLKAFDWEMIHFAEELDLQTHILLTKSDKLKAGAAKNTLKKVVSELSEYDSISIQLFSALTKTGLVEAKKYLTKQFL